MPYDYNHSNDWIWNLADFNDLPDLINATIDYVDNDLPYGYKTEHQVLLYNLHLAILQQHHDLSSLICVARNKTNNKIMAYGYISKSKVIYSSEPISTVEMAVVDYSESIKNRIKLLAQMAKIFENYCILTKQSVLVVNTIKTDQSGFLKLYHKLGYDIRGSFAFKNMKGKNYD